MVFEEQLDPNISNKITPIITQAREWRCGSSSKLKILITNQNEIML